MNQTTDKKLIRKNIILQSLDSGIFMSGMVFFHQMTILVALIQKLYDSPIIVSLISAIFFIGYNLPGLFTTRLAERFRYRKKFIATCGFIQRLFVICMALSLSLLDTLGPKPTAVLILIFYACFSSIGGFYNATWIDFCGKTIPVNFRARTNAIRTAIAGIGGILAPPLIDVLLLHYAFPNNYQFVILIGAVLLFMSFICFIQIKEVEPSPPVKKKDTRTYFASLIAVLRTDTNFVKFLLTQILLSVSECGAAFYTYFALNTFDPSLVNKSTVVFYTLLLNIGFSASGIVIGYIGDKLGNLQVARLGAFISLSTLLIVSFFPAPANLYLVFLLVGISTNARLNSFQVILTEFGDAKSRIRYTTLATALAGASFGVMPFLGGIFLDIVKIKFTTLFVFSALFALLALLSFTYIVKDPRTRRYS
ncbi:MAG: MFS transporter [Deltaproteobacteria bacterium]|nr:MFS transporter [Deltaproteobacteria bacterium]